jgi:hypothetical protein
MTEKENNKASDAPNEQDGAVDEELKAWQRHLVVPPEMASSLGLHDARQLKPCKDEAPAPAESTPMPDVADGGGTGLD